MRRRRPVTLLALAGLAVAAFLAVTVAACGSNQSDSSSSGADAQYKTYTDKTYGFSFQYPENWKLMETNAAEVTAGGSARGAVVVVDPKGAKVGDTYIDLLQAAVYELNTSIDESMMADVKTELEGVLAQLEAQDLSMKMEGSLTPTTVSGMPWFMVTYTFSQDGEPATSSLYFLFDGAIEYQLTVQAATKNWPAMKPVLETIVASFKPGAKR